MTNTRLTEARRILSAHSYHRIREHLISQEDSWRKRLILEWWAGARGVVILQSEKDEDGVQTYVNFGHGHTLDELEAVLAPIASNGHAAEVRAMMKADLWGEHPEFQRDEWRQEVGESNAQSGYWDWVISQCEQRDDVCEHDWQTTRSHGATVGYDAKRTKCGEETTFTPADD